MTVRPMEKGDADAWIAMRASLWPHADVTGLRDEVAAYLDRASGTVAVAFVADDERGERVGFVELSIRPFSDGCDSAPVPHIEGWYVAPHARRAGAGRALMRAAEEWSRARGFVELASDAELDDVASHQAHAAIGFEEVDRLVKFRKALGDERG